MRLNGYEGIPTATLVPEFSPRILRPPDGRLVAAAIRTFANIAKAWELTGTDAAKLMGVSRATYPRLQTTASREREESPRGTAVLRAGLADAELQARLSLLLGISGDLQSYNAKDREYGERWVRQSDSNRVFGGHTPLELMLSGTVVALWTVRRFTQNMLG